MRDPTPPSFKPASPLVKYGLIVFFIGLADAVMAYSAPVYIESIVKNPAIMGLIIASSSFVGFWADVIIGDIFGHKKYVFFLFWTIFLGIFFPLSLLLLPPIAPIFVVAMAIWGIYFELLEFANFHFIHEHLPHDSYDQSWGLIYVLKTLSYFIGPLIASTLILTSTRFPFYAALTIFIISFISYLFFHTKVKHHHDLPRKTKVSILKELSVWMILSKRVWPVWVFTLGIFIVDATYWSVGVLLSEQLRAQNPLGGWLLPAYILPAGIASLMVRKASLPFGKKKAAFISGLLGGLPLIFVGHLNNIGLLLILVTISAFFLSIAVPEILAVSEDYIKRLGKFSNDMVGLERSAVSLAYLIGPIIAGFTAAIIGYQRTFTVIGGVLVVISLIALVFTPRKIFMPQSELNTIDK